MTPEKSPCHSTDFSDGQWRYLLGLTLAGVVLFFYQLGAPGLMDPDEGRYAEIAREMLVLKDWLVPHLNFLPYLEKPPLVYWLTALSFKAFGATAWAARLPAAMAALGGVFLAYSLGKAWWGPRTGFLGALILATSGGYVILGRLIILDMPLTFFLNLGIGLGFLGFTQGRKNLLLWAYLALSLAVLIKGPVALVLAGLIWGLWTLIDRRQPLTFWLHPLGLVIMTGVILPWFVWVSVRYPEFLRFFLWEHHVSRFASEAFHHREPIYYYVPVLFGLMLPWSWLLPLALGRKKPTASSERLFLIIWAGVIFLFFTVSRGKLAPYILPALLPLALLLGETLANVPAGSQSEKRANLGYTLTLIIWAVFAGTLALLYFFPPKILVSKLEKAAILGFSLPAGLIILALTPAVALIWRVRTPLFVGAFLLCVLLPAGMEGISSRRSPKEMGLALRSHWQPGAALVGVRLYSQGLSFYSDQPFYLLEFRTELDFGRELDPESGVFFSTRDEMIAFAESKPLIFFFLRERAFPRLQQDLPGKFHTLAGWKDFLLVAYTRK